MNLKSTLAILCLCASVAVGAQPTITANTSTQPAGFTDQLYGNATFLAGNAGASQTWDFTAQSFTSAGPQDFESCNSVNNCTPFAGTTLVGNSSSAGGGYSYFKTSSSVYSLNGLGAGSSNIVYSDPEDLYRFPFTYGNAYTDPFVASFTSNGITFDRRGNDSVSADGYGTLKTPAGTFTNVLRIKRISTYRDSANISGMMFIITYKATIYTWNDAIRKDFLYTTSTIASTSQGQTTTSNYSRYTGYQSLGISNNSAAGSFSWQVFPNPASGDVHVSVMLPEPASVLISVTDITGRTVRLLPASARPSGNSVIDIPTSGLAPGVYTIRFTAGDFSDVRKLSVQ